MPTIKGTASLSSSQALSKLLRTTNFPSHFSTKVDTSKLHRGVLSHWIEQKINEILGFEDEIVSDTACNLFLPEEIEGSPPVEVDPRKAQLDLAGFLGEKESAEFASELWEMMIDGSSRKSGIPLVLVEKKKEEMRRAREMGGSRGGGYLRPDPPKRGVAGGPQGAEMNAFVREAARRAEMARAAVGGDGGARAVPPSPPGKNGELFTIDRTGDRYDGYNDNRRYGDDRKYGDDRRYTDDKRYTDDRNQSRGELDEFGRQRGNYPPNDRKPEQRRKRSPSTSRSRSRSSSVSSERRHRRRDDRRSKRSRSDSSDDMRRRRRDGGRDRR